MLNDFNKEFFFNNIYYLLKKRDIKIGDLESYSGVSTGYISRISKDEKPKPGIEFVIKVAAKLGVSVDELLGTNMEALTETENYIIGFINKLTGDTRSEKLLWERESAEYLNNLEPDRLGFIDHHLFTVENVKHVHENMVISNEAVVYLSETFGYQTFIAGDCYNLRLKNQTYLYLMNLGKEPEKVGEEVDYAKEIIIFKPNSGWQFLCNTKNHIFADKIQMLFETVEEYFRHPLIRAEFRDSIDAFMQDDIKDDPLPVNEVTGYPEEPPF